MAIEFNCPNCSAIIRVPDNAAGGKGRCPRCNTRIKVPKASAPRAPKKEDDDLGLELFAAPENDVAPGEVASAQPSEVASEPASLEEMFAPKSRGLGELPVESPRAPLRPGSMASKLKKKKSSGGLLVGLFFGVILCGVLGWYYFQTQMGERLGGELIAETAPTLELKPIEVSASLFKRSPDEMKKYVEELQKSPVRLPSVLMQVQISASKKAVTVHVGAGTQTQFYRIDVKNDPALMKFRSTHGIEFEEIRVVEVESAGAEFLQQYQRVLDKSAGQAVLNDFRNSFALPALVRGFGLQLVAVRGQHIYRCVYEDNDGALYFLMPPGIQEFEVTGKKGKDGKSLFPGTYKVLVGNEIQEPTKGKSDKKSKPSDEPKEEPAMSEPKDDGEMKEMKKDSDEGEMKMDEMPKKKAVKTK